MQLVHVLRRTPGPSAKAQLLSSPLMTALMHRASQLLPMACHKVCLALCTVEDTGRPVAGSSHCVRLLFMLSPLAMSPASSQPDLSPASIHPEVQYMIP